MNKGQVIGLLKQHGDAILTCREYINRVSTFSYHLCTLEFKEKYIKSKTKGKKPWPKNKTDIVVFDWTENKYWIVNPSTIIKLQPLAEVLQNVGNPLRKPER